jgi:lipopolysaccharide/colanic/teichoic acid biosynthesis glycosyltransferase
VFAAVALGLRRQGAGPVLFRQIRVGRDFRPFQILKFRTMVPGADRMGPGITPGRDPRVTRFGALLRWTKLDELPQLWNVLRGDMSLVGPRPELPQYTRLFEDDFREILRVRPGITDLASLAYRDEAGRLDHEPIPSAPTSSRSCRTRSGWRAPYVSRASLRLRPEDPRRDRAAARLPRPRARPHARRACASAHRQIALARPGRLWRRRRTCSRCG